MATDKPRFTITLDPETLDQVIEYKNIKHFATQSKAIQRLIEIGICDVKSEQPIKATRSHDDVPLASDEIQLLEDYRSLTPPGKEYIRQTMAMAVTAYSAGEGTLPYMEAE